MTTVRFVEGEKVYVRVFAWFGPEPHGDPVCEAAMLCNVAILGSIDAQAEDELALQILRRMERRFWWNCLIHKLNSFTKKRTV
jgi:hypothetical protein